MRESDDIDVESLTPETLVRLGTIEMLNQGNVDRADDLYTPTLTYYNTAGEEGTLEDLKDDARAFHDAFPDLEADVVEVVVDGGRGGVAFEYVLRGTQEHAFDTYAPTGNRMEARGIGFASLEDGRIDEYYVTFDLREMLGSLGALVI